MLNFLKVQKIDIQALTAKMSLEDVYKLTNSPRIGQVLANWDKYEDPVASVGTTASFFFYFHGALCFCF